jgi:hypothetical protein
LAKLETYPKESIDPHHPTIVFVYPFVKWVGMAIKHEAKGTFALYQDLIRIVPDAVKIPQKREGGEGPGMFQR